jgi:hypothetical protein
MGAETLAHANLYTHLKGGPGQIGQWALRATVDAAARSGAHGAKNTRWCREQREGYLRLAVVNGPSLEAKSRGIGQQAIYEKHWWCEAENHLLLFF